jgi:hypothetical protein
MPLLVMRTHSFGHSLDRTLSIYKMARKLEKNANLALHAGMDGEFLRGTSQRAIYEKLNDSKQVDSKLSKTFKR